MEYVTVIGSMSTKPEPMYYPMVVVDLLMAVLLGSAGLGLLRRRDWAGALAVAALAAWLVNSLGLVLGIFAPGIVRSPGFWKLIVWILAPRLLFYLLALVSAPFLLRCFLIEKIPPDLRRRRKRWMAGSILLSGLFVLVIVGVRWATK